MSLFQGLKSGTSVQFTDAEQAEITAAAEQLGMTEQQVCEWAAKETLARKFRRRKNSDQARVLPIRG